MIMGLFSQWPVFSMVSVFPMGRGYVLFPWVFFAQQETPAPEGPSLFGLLWPILAIVILFWLFLIRPQQKEREKIARMLASLKKNDRVITIGGIYGVVTNIRREADEVTLKVDDNSNVRIKVSLGAIARVLGEEPEGTDSGEKKSGSS
jgi:preprotein translocase subunit YajC